MVNRQKKTNQTFIFYVLAIFIFLMALFFCFFMVSKINKRMNESATTNLLNTTLVIRNTLEGNIEKDQNSLNIIGDFHKNGEHLESDQIKSLCNSMGFEWIAIVDEYGNGVDFFEQVFQATDISCYDQWRPGEIGYSDPYIGQSGRSQIVLWIPIYQNDIYIGTVFGGVILSKYYSADIFTFYDGDGRTYLFDSYDGSWILKSLGTDGAQTRQEDIYSLLLASKNDKEDIEIFRKAVNERRTGTATFDYNGEQSYLCFLPLSSSSDWYITTVIAKEVLLKEAEGVQRMIQWILAILCIILVVFTVVVARLWVRKTQTKEAEYREKLFANISANLDSAFLIYDKNNREVAFVSDNIKRLLGIDRNWISGEVGRLFDWCGISEEDSQRQEFQAGELNEPIVREICVENELGETSRNIRLELIPADLGQELAVLTDITGDKEIQNSLIEAMKRAEAASNAKNDFLSAVSHDLRTPINGIVGMTAIAGANLTDAAKVQNCLAKISESTAHLLKLINEVLDMSQIERGKMQLAQESFNLAELLQNVLNVNYPGMQQKKHNVKIYIHLMEHEEVIGDPVQLTRIATNLISNAIKYTPTGGEIKLTLREKETIISGFGCFELTVQDNGIGMSEEFQEKLFEPFEREEDVRLSRIQGTGLGMSIVKNIVDLMLGSIEVESEKGKGSTFKVTLNLRLAQKEEKKDEQFAGLPVLVVDEDMADCQTATKILCDLGMKGEWANNGKDAVNKVVEKKAQGKDYAAILLAWKMADMDGIETTRQIRSKVGNQVPIIILTAYVWNDIEKEAKEAGVSAFLSKPIYKSKLLQKIEEIVAENINIFRTTPSVKDGEITKKCKVLLGEDNALNREIAIELLKMMGIETDCAEDGVAAVEKFAGSQPGTYDLILMDIQMPRMNGYEATREIRSMDRTDGQTIPIVAMTADAFQKDKQAAMEAGMNEHLAKPISVESLTQVLIRYLKK